jgi:hypothetical protein
MAAGGAAGLLGEVEMKSSRQAQAVVVAVVWLLAAGATRDARAELARGYHPGPPAGQGGGLAPGGKGWAVRVAKPPGAVQPLVDNGIYYHGGPILLGTNKVYYIWYGNWSGNTATTILTDWANHLGGSPYYGINTTYYNGLNQDLSNSLVYGGETFDSYSQGSTIDDNGVVSIVETAINNHALPLDPHALYFVLTSADVVESTGFCSFYCGWHTYATINNTSIKYSFVGNPDQCPSACEGFFDGGPNGNSGADGMASVMAHELAETVTDPELDAWYDNSGQETGDKCAWTFGNIYTAGNGAGANVHLGSRDFLLQQLWVDAGGGYCAMSFAANPSKFHTVTPCRLIDTRNPNGPAGGPALQPSQIRTFALAGSCGIPSTATSLSVNVTVTQPTAIGNLVLYPANQGVPQTSVINYVAGQTRANNAVLGVSADGTVSVSVVEVSAGTVQFVLDVNGYFQ